MHSGFEIPGIQPNDNTCAAAPILLSMNHTNHILDQMHGLPTTQQLFLEHHHHLLPPHHHYADSGASPYFPAVNFKLGLNEICSRSKQIKDRGGEGLQFEVQKNGHSSLGILHCWNDQQDSSLKQQPFWEPLPAEVSNENSEIVDRQEHMELNQKQALISNPSLDGKDHRVQFGELEAIYNRCEKKITQQSDNLQLNHNSSQIPSDFDHGCEESRKKKRRRKKKGSSYYSSHLMTPMAEFFSNFVKQMMDHQESLHHKFTEMIERLDEERRAREEYWRNQEMAHLQQEAMARAREKTLAQSREAMIVSYLEKITGQKVNFSAAEIASTGNEQPAKKGQIKSV